MSLRRRVISRALFAGFIFAATACDPARIKKAETAHDSDTIKVYGLKYGESLYPANLVNTASREKHVRLNWLAYLIEFADGRRILVDCGFSDPALLRRFAIQKFRSVSDILSDLKISAGQINTVILTHTHFDHALDAGKFPNARVILHQKEAEQPQEAALRPILAALNAQGKMQTVDAAIRLDGLDIQPVMGHTPGSLVVYLKTAGREIVFTGDECYFAESCRAGIFLPPGAVYSAAANRRFIESLSPQATILTGHETALTEGRWLNDYGFLFF